MTMEHGVLVRRVMKLSTQIMHRIRVVRHALIGYFMRVYSILSERALNLSEQIILHLTCTGKINIYMNNGVKMFLYGPGLSGHGAILQNHRLTSKRGVHLIRYF